MTLGGLLEHLALVEDHYTARDLTGQPEEVSHPTVRRVVMRIDVEQGAVAPP